MSYSYSTQLALGVIIKREDIIKKLGKIEPEVNHSEERWDPRTGNKIDNVTVVDKPEREILCFDGERFEDDSYELYTALAESVGASYEELINVDWRDQRVHVFAVPTPLEARYSEVKMCKGALDSKRTYYYEDRIKTVRLAWLSSPDTLQKMADICKELDKLGFAHSEPVVISVLDKE